MPTPDFAAELNDADELLLARFRVSHFYELYPQLESCVVFSSFLESKLLIIAPDDDTLALLHSLLPALRFNTYVLFGVEAICFRYQQALVCQMETMLIDGIQAENIDASLESSTTLDSNNLAIQEFTNMTSTTVAHPDVEIASSNTPVPTAPTTGVQSIQRLEELGVLVAKAGIDLKFAVDRLQQLGLFVGVSGDGSYQTTWQSWTVFADDYAKYAAQSMKSLVGVPSSQQLITMPAIEPMTTETPAAESVNGAEAPQTNGAKPRRGRKSNIDRKPPAAKRTARQPTQDAKPLSANMRFKAFRPSNSASGTIGNFLSAQNFDEATRIEIIENIANAPEQVNADDNGTITEKVISAIEKTCKATGNRLSRVKMIEAAKSMMAAPAEA